MTTLVNDPFESANAPALRPLEFWGQISVTPWYCVLQKGVGRIPYDSTQHQPDQRRTAIDFVLVPLTEFQATRNVERSLIAESIEYARLVLPSITALGVTVQNLNNSWVKIGFQETGKTYIDRRTGESKSSTTLKFEKIFPNEEACRADYYTSLNMEPQKAAQSAALVTERPATPVAAPVVQTALPNTKERQTALEFVKVIVKNAAMGRNDIAEITQMVDAQFKLPNMDMVSKHFNAASPEVAELILMEVSK